MATKELLRRSRSSWRVLPSSSEEVEARTEAANPSSLVLLPQLVLLVGQSRQTVDRTKRGSTMVPGGSTLVPGGPRWSLGGTGWTCSPCAREGLRYQLRGELICLKCLCVTPAFGW